MRRFLLLVVFIIILSYGQTILMYFWQDDSALMFRLQHPVGPMGSFGPSIWADRGAYRYMVIPFVPFFSLFGLQPVGYFAIGLLTYAIAAGCFYLFARELFKKKENAQIATLFFAAGYIGSDMMFRIINSWQSNTGLILSLLTLFYYARFKNNGKLKHYLYGLVLYLATIELVYIRSHSLVGSIVIMELLFSNIKSLKWSLIRLVPFIALFYFWYFRDPNFGSPDLPNIAMLTSFFGTIGNGFVPSAISEAMNTKYGLKSALVIFTGIVACFSLLIHHLGKNKRMIGLYITGSVIVLITNYMLFIQDFYWYTRTDAFLSVLAGTIVAYSVGIVSLFSWRQSHNLGKILVVGFTILSSQIFGYFMQYPTSLFSSTHRYLYFSSIGYCIVFAGLVSVIHEKVRSYVVATSLCVLLVLGIGYQAKIVRERSIPSRDFYASLLTEVPTISKGAVFYFEIEDNPFYQRQFSDFFSVGSMPESTALAIYYGLDRDDIRFVTNYDELVSILAKDQKLIDQTYAFYYGSTGLKNRTQQLRTSLLTQQVDPTPPGYVDVSFEAKTAIDKSQLQKMTRSPIDTILQAKILSYLRARDAFYKTASITSLSEWRYQEIANALDMSSDTSWRGHRIYWDDNEHDAIVVELPHSVTISRFVWTNWIPSLTPTSYTIQVSNDSKTWTKVFSMEDGLEKEANQRVEQSFSPVSARYVKMDIEDTLTNDSPGIADVEVIESQYDALTLKFIQDFLVSPFTYVNTPPPGLSTISVTVYTDKGKSTVWTPIKSYDTMISYTVPVLIGGSRIDKVEVTAPAPLNLNYQNTEIKSIRLEDLNRRGFVKEFSKN